MSTSRGARRIRFEFVEPNTKGRGARSFLGVDCIVSSDADHRE
jgi:hypothetical protein